MKFFAKTDYGIIRQTNQDYFIAENRTFGVFPNLFIVADGAGGNRESAFASKHCADFVVDQLSLSNKTDYINELRTAFELANMDLVYKIVANPTFKGMGTTMVLTSIFDDRAIIANVGDSRCYLIRDNITQITKDHSFAEELVEEKTIERNSDTYKALKNQLTRAFGASKRIRPDFFEIEIEQNDYLLLCSDGLTNMVDDQEIYKIIVGDDNLETKVQTLISLANKNGGKDNITIILIYIDTSKIKNDIIEKPPNEKTLKQIFEKKVRPIPRSRRKIEEANENE